MLFGICRPDLVLKDLKQLYGFDGTMLLTVTVVVAVDTIDVNVVETVSVTVLVG